MIEVEIKLKIHDPETVEKGLRAMGFVPGGSFCEEDCYFDNEAGQIRKNGEALRIRRVTDRESGTAETVITFKGKKLDQVSASRRELETTVGSAETGMQILEALGFRKVLPQVQKNRQEYRRGRITACLDRVKGLGDFLELEILTEGEMQKTAALEQIETVLCGLGYSMKDTTRSSYLGMLQRTGEKSGM